MTKTTQQIADEMARKCADQIHSQHSDEWFSTLSQEAKNNEHYSKYVELHKFAVLERQRLAGVIAQQIPLSELLEVARAAKISACRHSSDMHNTNCPLCIALTNLQKKVEL